MKLGIKPWQLIIIAFIVIGCSSPKEVQTPTIHSVPDLEKTLQISQIRSIQLADDWSGLPDYGPVEAHSILRPKGTEFQGEVTFKAGGDVGNPLTDTEEIVIPESSVQAFLNKLAEAPLQDGKYEPYFDHTDDYPSLMISIELQSETISFYTTSQGPYYSPWAVTINNKTYIIDSGVPTQALMLFTPYLKKEKLAQLEELAIKDAYTDTNATKEPTVTP